MEQDVEVADTPEEEDPDAYEDSDLFKACAEGDFDTARALIETDREVLARATTNFLTIFFSQSNTPGINAPRRLCMQLH